MCGCPMFLHGRPDQKQPSEQTRISVRRHRSQEWQDYSSSDNEDHHHVESRAYRYPTADEPYEEQRNPDSRKHGLGKLQIILYPSRS
ncbi:hypothetical protein CEXT_777961 [Caerostris extrusa]|uniref:Uncharacterized protein n=1 Tax=Caerostris extrusa TaxID=172846 RepID=A0AAV4RHE8_CAEEX|nr:hypothetical protein CEXT_777961 [Caerostris extrusa]